MKIYGTGVFTSPGTSRVIHDFVDGPFDTVNPVLIEEAKRRGYSFVAPPPPPEFVKRGPGRPPKVVDNADEKSKATEVSMGDRSRAGKEVREGNAKGKEVAKEKEGE
jgi:hypothetical protein